MSGGVVHVVGARPHFSKLAAVLRAQSPRLATLTQVVDTGQHYDATLSGVFFDALGLPVPAAALAVGSGSAGQQTGRMLIALEEALQRLDPALVVVYGDTHSTLAGALAAAHRGVACVHVEAGLRSFDRSMPEEINRVLVDHVCERLYAPTDTAAAQLAAEGLAQRTELTGDLLADATLYAESIALQHSRILDLLALGPGGYGVVTLHRAANTQPDRLPVLLAAVEQAAQGIGTVIWPVHPRSHRALQALGSDWTARLQAAGVRRVEPMGPFDMLRLVADAQCLLTDSGGLQKEAFLLGTPCITLREQTEWTETLVADANRLADTPEAVSAALALWRRECPSRATLRQRALAAYGQGRAGARIAASLEHLLDARER